MWWHLNTSQANIKDARIAAIIQISHIVIWMANGTNARIAETRNISFVIETYKNIYYA